MIEHSAPQEYYSRGIAYGDVKGAPKASPVKIARHEFVTRIFHAYLDDEGRYCENLVDEQPQVSDAYAS